jgi:hypothetical protein
MGRTLIRNLFTSSNFLAIYLFMLFLLFVFAQYISPISFCPCNEAVSLSSHLLNDFCSCFSSWALFCPHLSGVLFLFFAVSAKKTAAGINKQLSSIKMFVYIDWRVTVPRLQFFFTVYIQRPKPL